MTNNVSIRPFQATDAPSVVEIWNGAFKATQPWHDPREMLCRKANQYDGMTFVAEVDAVIVGAVMVGYDGVRGWIYHITVSPDHQRRGIGRLLLKKAESTLQAAGCPKINLQVLPTNADVRAFYERSGYNAEDRISFGKPLAPHKVDVLDPVPEIRVTDRIRLSRFESSDRPKLLEHLNKDSIFRDNSLVMPYPYTEFDADQWLARAPIESCERDGIRNWAIRDAMGDLIGGVGLLNIRQGERAEIGYWLAKPFWGQGIMTSVVRRICDFAFDAYQLHRLHAYVFAPNSKSAAVLKRVGFNEEGCLREHVVRDGTAIDMLLFGLLKKEFQSDEKQIDHAEPGKIDSSPTTAEIAFIDARLQDFNTKTIGRDDFTPKHYVIRNAEGDVIAGLKAVTGWDWLYVQTLWVAKEHRKSGYGSQLLSQAEDDAVKIGCVGSCLTSFTFQAPVFYEKHGYSRFGKIENYPLDSTMHFLSKRFDR